jgi:hypothetical protein
MDNAGNEKLTAEFLRNALFYNPATGVFWHRYKSKSTIAGHLRSDGYVAIMVHWKWYAAHRLAWMYVHGSMPCECIDHINGIPSDNRIVNLREATNAQNQQNQRKAQKNNKSGMLGVSPRKGRKKWGAVIRINYKSIWLGGFDSKEEAAAAYLAAKASIHPFETISAESMR